MGIVFEENDTEFGGIFVLEISEGSSAETNGTIRPGDQLVSVGAEKVFGMQFEKALGKNIDTMEEKIDFPSNSGAVQLVCVHRRVAA